MSSVAVIAVAPVAGEPVSSVAVPPVAPVAGEPVSSVAVPPVAPVAMEPVSSVTEPPVAPDENGELWRPRLARIEGVEPAQLSRLHGTLIALGCLKFELSGKVGVQYQLTPLGRQTLERGLGTGAEAEAAA